MNRVRRQTFQQHHGKVKSWEGQSLRWIIYICIFKPINFYLNKPMKKRTSDVCGGIEVNPELDFGILGFQDSTLVLIWASKTDEDEPQCRIQHGKSHFRDKKEIN